MKSLSPQKSSSKTFFTITPSILALTLDPIPLKILNYFLIRKGVPGGWKFRISDIAKMLGLSYSTTKRHLKPLTELGIVYLTGGVGRQFYAFNDAACKKYAKRNPFQNDTPQSGLNGGPVKVEGGTPVRDGRVHSTEEHSKEIIVKKGTTHTSGNNLVVGSHQGANAPASGFITGNIQGVADAPAVSGNYQGPADLPANKVDKTFGNLSLYQGVPPAGETLSIPPAGVSHRSAKPMTFRKDDKRPDNPNNIWMKLYRKTGDELRARKIENYPLEIDIVRNTNARYKELYDIAAEEHCEYANRFN
jgi:DNA-binding transcriptional ArsR family regulator